MTKQSFLEQALYAESHGFSVIRNRPGEKVPFGTWTKNQTTRDTPEEITAKWEATPDCNIGYALGQVSGGIFAMDVDQKPGQEGAETLHDLQREFGDIPDSWEGTTASGGRHIMLRVPPGTIIGNRTGFYGANLDVKGDGGQVVGAGSMVKGRFYKWKPGHAPHEFRNEAGELDCELAPAFLIELLQVTEESKRAHEGGLGLTAGTAATAHEGITKDEWGAVIDGREKYMTNMVWSETINVIANNGGQPVTFDQLFDLIWPQYMRGVKARNGTLDQEGRGSALLTDKINQVLKPGKMARIEKLAGEQYERDQSPALSDDWHKPFDIFGTGKTPEFPLDALPEVLRHMVAQNSRLLGVDQGAIALATLCVCTFAIKDANCVQVMEHDQSYTEHPRLWGILVGDPSTRKSPAIKKAVAPLNRIYKAQRAAWEEDLRRAQEREVADDDLPAAPTKLIVNDCTPERIQVDLQESERGILSVQDELASLLDFDKYKGRGAKASSAERAFYLTGWSGGPFHVGRMTREVLIEDLSLSILGGIQPEAIRAENSRSHDDGFMQRFNICNMDRAAKAIDEPRNQAIDDAYDGLVAALIDEGDNFPRVFKFSDEARPAVNEFIDIADELSALGEVSGKFAAWAGKLVSQFARISLAVHFIEHAGRRIPDKISAATVKNVTRMFRQYFIPHSFRFFTEVLYDGSEMKHGRWIAGYMLKEGLERFTMATISQAYREFRSAPEWERRKWLSTLEHLGWIRPETTGQDCKAWKVNPRIHLDFAERAEIERKTREANRKAVLIAVGACDE